jgi:hypothetical protein
MKEDLKRCPFCEEEFNSFSEEYDHECEICVDNLWIEGKIEDIQFAKKIIPHLHLIESDNKDDGILSFFQKIKPIIKKNDIFDGCHHWEDVLCSLIVAQMNGFQGSGVTTSLRSIGGATLHSIIICMVRVIMNKRLDPRDYNYSSIARSIFNK